MVAEIFLELSLIVIIATIVSGVMRLLKQPLIIGYILTGILVSPYALNIIHSHELIGAFSDIGIALLLFIIGLNLNIKTIKDVGGISIKAGVLQVLLTTAFGFFISLAFGFSWVISLYIAIALAFSSTIIITKLFTDKGEIDSLHGKISVGILLVQDLIVVFVLLFISSFTKGLNLITILTQSILIMVALVLGIFLFGKFILSKIMKLAAKSQELLFLVAFSWCLLVCAAFYVSNFPIEIGALLAGVTLASTPYRFEIASKMKPLRDFFLVIFFVSLGSQLIFGNIGPYIAPIIVLSLFVIIVKPLIIMTLMGIFGYRKRTSFQTAIALAQISEFSLIFIALARDLSSVPQDIVSLITIIALVSILTSSYMILHSRKIYNVFSKYLGIFEKKEKGKTDYKYYENSDHEVILFGYNRAGGDVLHSLSKLKKKVLIVDYNPNTILELAKRGFDSVYGDANDIELLNDLNFAKAKMVISTVSDFDANLLLVKEALKKNKEIITIVISNQIDEANELYKNGATYVILPNYIGGHYASTMIEKYGFNTDDFLKEKLEHLKYLKRKSRKPKYLVYKTKSKTNSTNRNTSKKKK